jgi:hypothetical protein
MDSYLLNKNNISHHVVEHQQAYLLGAGRVEYQDRQGNTGSNPTPTLFIAYGQAATSKFTSHLHTFLIECL